MPEAKQISNSMLDSEYEPDSKAVHGLPDPPPYSGHPDGPDDDVAVADGADIISAPQSHWREPPRWLQINLLVCKITVFVMWFAAIVNIVFAGVIMEDLKDDHDDYGCEANYIADASEPWAASDPTSPDRYNWDLPGRYHSQCRRLFAWTYIVTVAGSFGMFRPVLQIVSAYYPTKWSVKYRRGSGMDRVVTPSSVYAVRTVFSLIPFVFYLAGAVVLMTSRLITGPPARDSYRDMYLIHLAIIWVSAVVTGHQTFTTGYASYKLQGWKDFHRDER